MTAERKAYQGWVPQGHQWNMIAASLFKRWLLQEKMDAGLRLRLLESLERMTDIYLRPEMIAMIEPACDTAYSIWKEATTLDHKDEVACMASYRVLTSPHVFNHFIELNPSIFAAIEWREAYRGDDAKQQAPNPVDAARDQTTAPTVEVPERYHIHNVPTETAGAASIYNGNYPGIPDRFFDRPERQQYANGTPNNNPINPHTGR